MSRTQRITLAAISSALVLVLTTSLVAQVRSQSQAAKHRDIVKAMDENQITLAKAIEAAEKESTGRAVGVRADMEGEKLVFTVQCSVGDELKPVNVDHKGKATVRGKKDDKKKDDKKEEPKPEGEPAGGENPRRARPTQP